MKCASYPPSRRAFKCRSLRLDPTHAEHHFSLGQVLATVMLGSMDALTAYTNPAAIGSSITNFVNGFLQIWLPGSTQQVPPAGSSTH